MGMGMEVIALMMTRLVLEEVPVVAGEVVADEEGEATLEEEVELLVGVEERVGQQPVSL